jgi:hypothetical protein
MSKKKDVEETGRRRGFVGTTGCITKRRCRRSYPMPVADELFDDLGGSDCFSTLDLKMGYHQIRIRVGDQYKLAF